jgi:uncharacterized Tic20 family protein
LSFKSWWCNKKAIPKAIVILVALLLIQISLALSTEYTVLPAVEAITRESWRGEVGPFALFFLQALLCIPTLVLLVIAIIIRAIQSRRQRPPLTSIVPPRND